jgi:hypothetical protein
MRKYVQLIRYLNYFISSKDGLNFYMEQKVAEQSEVLKNKIENCKIQKFI